jgi:hypothetical protein
MAKDFDFRRKASHAKPTPTVAKSFVPKPAERYRARKSRAKWSMGILCFGLIAVAIAVYWQFNQSRLTSQGESANTTAEQIEPQQVKVGVYAEGTDLTICRDLANNISEQGYVAICIGSSLASHPKTEIWSLDSYKSEAQKINTAQGLNADFFTLSSESQYQIIIYTGS